MNIVNTLKNINELVMFKHTVFSLPFIFIAMVVAASGWFGWELLILGLLAAVFARNYAMGVNRYLDRDIDVLNPRTASRPSVDGRVSLPFQVIFIFINFIGFIVVSYFVNDLAFMLSLPILLVLGAYTYFKRFSYLAHLILGLSLGLAPIAGVVAIDAEVPLWSILLAIGVMFWVAGFDLLYSLQDIEFDSNNNLHSIPSRFGAEKTLHISQLFHILTILFWTLFVITSGSGLFLYIGVIISAIMLIFEHRIVLKDFTKIDKAFFTINGYIGFIMLLFTIIDVTRGNIG